MKILIADDHTLVRKALKFIIKEAFADVEIEEAADGSELLMKATKNKWDIIVSDISFPGLSGLDILKQLKIHAPQIPVLMLTMYSAEEYAIRCIRSGAAGFLSKDNISDELIKAINQILSGKKYINSDVAMVLATAYEENVKSAPHESLTDREFAIFKQLLHGKSMQAIGDDLCISVTTVRAHKVNILKKMHLTSDAEMIKYGLQNQII
ncbi:response regulator [Parasediminibacterium paludis]|uniref:Response regulator n=1 Tax=Parasediminibacterium paludis TaxID=908966 RepID=A0ABV8PUQ1_9BACT